MPSQPFLALITPVSEGGGGWDTFPKPMPVPPGVVTPPIYYPPYPSQGPGFPTHPIAPGGPSPSQPIYWPQPPVYPSQGPGFPTHPIYIPGPPGYPPVIATLPVFPPEATHPIVLPPDVAPPETPEGRPIEWKAAWTPATGWVVVGFPTGEHPTPSTAQPAAKPKA